MDALTASPLCPASLELQLAEIRFAAPELIVTATARRRVVACPKCGHASTRVHSRYRRTLADLPWHGLRVRLDVHVRRFFCDVPGCKRRIFTERFASTALLHARRTARLSEAFEILGLALGGEPSARVAGALGMAISGDTMLRHLHCAVTDVDQDGPRLATRAVTRVLGVDDWAWRKGQTYGTILVDLEQHRVIDLLPDRTASTLTTWLARHPGVERIARDRSTEYARGASAGAPGAIQIADRWHLLLNARQMTERWLAGVHMRLRQIPPLPVISAFTPSARRTQAYHRTEAEAVATAESRKRWIVVYDEVKRRRAAGEPLLAISRTMGIARATARKYAYAQSFPERAVRVPAPSILDPYLAHLDTRVTAGCENASELWREIRDGRGFHGGLTTVLAWARLHLRGMVIPKISEASLAIPARPTSRPSSRRAAWLLTAPSEQLKAPELRYVELICEASSALADVHALAIEFRRMLKAHDPNALAPWLDQAERSELRSLGSGLRRDKDAVLAAILFPWSNGQVEGQVNRLKLIKRTMYGRAGFALLRRRVLAA